MDGGRESEAVSRGGKTNAEDGGADSTANAAVIMERVGGKDMSRGIVGALFILVDNLRYYKDLRERTSDSEAQDEEVEPTPDRSLTDRQNSDTRRIDERFVVGLSLLFRLASLPRKPTTEMAHGRFPSQYTCGCNYLIHHGMPRLIRRLPALSHLWQLMVLDYSIEAYQGLQELN